MNKDNIHGALDCLAVMLSQHDDQVIFSDVIKYYGITPTELEQFKNEWFYDSLNAFVYNGKWLWEGE